MVEFLDARNFGERLARELPRCCSFHVAVSYIRLSGISVLLNASSEQVSRSLIITCTDFGITEPEALTELLKRGYDLRAFKAAGLHAKVWLLRFLNQESIMFVGSSNLSRAAVSNNVEANVRVDQSDSIAKASAWFEELTNPRITVKINEGWIAEYQTLRTLTPPQERYIPADHFAEFPPLAESSAPAIEDAVVDERINANGTWFTRRPSYTFRVQGIPNGLTEIDVPGLPWRGHVTGVRLILLIYDEDGEPVVWRDVAHSTLNGARELGRKRADVLAWIHNVWGNATDFEYEVAVEVRAGTPTIWLRPAKGP